MQQLIDLLLRPIYPVCYFWKRRKIQILTTIIILEAAYIIIR